MEAGEQLEHEDLENENGRVQLLLAVPESELRERQREIVHDEVQVNVGRALAARFERVLEADDIGMLHELQDVEFAVFVARVFEDLFDCDHFAVGTAGNEDRSECTATEEADRLVLEGLAA